MCSNNNSALFYQQAKPKANAFRDPTQRGFNITWEEFVSSTTDELKLIIMNIDGPYIVYWLHKDRFVFLLPFF